MSVAITGERLAPQGFAEAEWTENHKPFYFMTAPKGVVVGIYTTAKDALEAARPGLRIMCGLGMAASEADRFQVWPTRG